MICEKCGREIDERASYCKYCGQKQSQRNSDAVKKDLNPENNTGNFKLKVLIPVFILIVIAMLAFVAAQYSEKDKGDFRGEWFIMSGNTSGNVEAINFYDEENVIADDFSGTYVVDEDFEMVTMDFDIGIGLTCDYFFSHGFLLLKSPETDEVAVYINLDKTSQKEFDEYCYAQEEYEQCRPKEYLLGRWGRADELSEPYSNDFEVTEDDDGYSMSWDANILPAKESDIEDDEGFDIGSDFLITVDGLNAYQVIPVADDKAYFYCYQNNTLKLFKKL